MAFKDGTAQFQRIALSCIDPDADHARQVLNEESLKGLTNSIRKVGLIHPLVVRPAATEGRYTVVVGERRRQAALRAGEESVPVLIRDCSGEEALEVQVFENIGLGVRTALEPRDMANAIETIARRFDTPEDAAQHFGRAVPWLGQATAAAHLSDKVSALLDTGKIASTSAAVQLERLAKKNEAKADSLIEQIGQLPDGEKASRKIVDTALSEEIGRGRKKKEPAALEPAAARPPEPVAGAALPPWEEAGPAPLATETPRRTKVNPGKVRKVAELLGLSEEDEEDILIRLIDEFLALKGA